MTDRLRAWLEETHGTNFELVRHFLLRFFDNDMGAVRQRLAEGRDRHLGHVPLRLDPDGSELHGAIRPVLNRSVPTPEIYRPKVRADDPVGSSRWPWRLRRC